MGVTRPRPGHPPRRDREGPDRLGGGARRDGPARRRGGRSARTLVVRSTEGPESMLLVPMTFDGTRPRRHRRVQGRAATASTTTTRRPSTIFAGYAAQALVNGDEHRAPAPPAGRARAPARGPAPPARGQRAAPVDPRAGRRPRPDRRFTQGDRAVRLADHLPGRPGRRRPPRGHRPRPVRRPDPRPREPARRPGSAAGSIDHGEAVLANEAHLDPRSIQVPGHPVRARGDDRRAADHQRLDHRHTQHRPDGRGRGGLQRRTSSS